jgi:hypothetical protein
MIRRLRARHRTVWLVLAWLLPLLYALALWRRPAPPREGSLPASLLYDELERQPRNQPGVGEEP